MSGVKAPIISGAAISDPPPPCCSTCGGDARSCGHAPSVDNFELDEQLREEISVEIDLPRFTVVRSILALFALAIALHLGGCATAPPAAAAPDLVALRATVPTCSSDRQCAGMWSAARNWVTSSCGMKIQTITDNFIETYGPIDGNLACRITRDPEPAGFYSFHVFVNYGAPFMGKFIAEKVGNFQRTVSAAGDSFK